MYFSLLRVQTAGIGFPDSDRNKDCDQREFLSPFRNSSQASQAHCVPPMPTAITSIILTLILQGSCVSASSLYCICIEKSLYLFIFACQMPRTAAGMEEALNTCLLND